MIVMTKYDTVICVNLNNQCAKRKEDNKGCEIFTSNRYYFEI